MSQKAYRPKSLFAMKYKSNTPICQPTQNNVKKRFSQRGKEQEDGGDINEVNIKNRDAPRQKSSLNNTIQQAILNNNFIKQSQNATDLVYLGGNIQIQNPQVPTRRVMTAIGVKKQHSRDYHDLNTDEFSDLNLVQRKLQLNVEDMYSDTRNVTSKFIKQSLKTQTNQSSSAQQNITPSTSSICTQNSIGSRNKISSNLMNNSQNTKVNKYISIKETIAAYKDVEQKIVMKNNEQTVPPPILITTNHQLPQTSCPNSLQLLKQAHSEDRLNVVGPSSQQNQLNNSEKKPSINKNKQNYFINNGNITCSSQTTNNKENSTTVSTTSANSGGTIFSLLLNPSTILPPQRVNNLNAFRIKKQNSTRNSFIQYQPTSSTQIPQINASQQYDINNIYSSINPKTKLFSNEQNYLENQEGNESFNIERNIEINNISINNMPNDEMLSNKSQNRKGSQLIFEAPFTPLQFNKSEQNQSEKNNKKSFCSSRQIQLNKQIQQVSKNQKNSYKNSEIVLGNNNICRTNIFAQQSQSCVHQKRNSEKISSTFLQIQQSHWSPDASIMYQDEISLDQIPCITNRSQSTYQKPNNYQNNNQKDEILDQNLIKSNLLQKKNKTQQYRQILKMINCADIKPIYWRQVIIDATENDYERNVLIIKADNLLFGGISTQNFWEKKENINNNLIGDNNVIGDIQVNKLNEIKKIFRTLSKHYLLFLLFNNQNKKVRDIVSYMIKTNFQFDGAYYVSSPITNNLQQNKSINLQQIIIDFKITNVNKVVIFDAVPYNFQVNLNQNKKKNQPQKPQNSISSKRKLFPNQTSRKADSEEQLLGGEKKSENEQGLKDDDNNDEKSNSKLISYKLKTNTHFDLLQDFIPKFEDKILEKTKIVLFKQKINPNLLQANQKKILEVALSFVDPRIKSFSTNLYFVSLDISDVTAKAYNEGLIEHKKRGFLKQINQLKQSNKNTKEIIELDGDKVSENFRNRLIEYMKSTQKQIPNLYYLVGDLVVRNRAIFQKYYTDPFHCKKKNIDNLLQLDILRYKLFPQLAKQVFFQGKQAQQYSSLISQLPLQNPYEIMFNPDDNQITQYKSEISLKSTNSNLDEVEQKIQNKEKQDIDNENNTTKKRISYLLPFNVYLCTEISG